MMFWKKKQTANRREMQQYVGVDRLQERVDQLEKQVKQIRCSHDFNFSHYVESFAFSDKVVFKCPDCGKQKIRRWERLIKEEQRALKTLNLIPDYWEIKEDEPNSNDCR